MEEGGDLKFMEEKGGGGAGGLKGARSQGQRRPHRQEGLGLGLRLRLRLRLREHLRLRLEGGQLVAS